MSDVTVPNTVKSITTIVNSSIAKKILTEDNYEVTKVRLDKDGRRAEFVAVDVVVDLAKSLEALPMSSTDRYSKRTVHLTRVNISDIADFREIPKNKLGQYVIADATAAGVIAALKAAITEEELEIRKLKNCSTVTVVSNSYGFYGNFTIGAASAADDDNGPLIPQPISAPEITAVTLNTGSGVVTLGETLKASHTVTPANAVANSVVYSANVGSIDASTGVYTPAAAGKATITVTVDGVTASKEITVNYKELTNFSVTAPTKLKVATEASIVPVITEKNVDPALAVKFVAKLGTIDETGSYIAPEEAGTETITVTIGKVVKTVTINIEA